MIHIVYPCFQPADWGTLKSLRKRFAYLNQDSPIFMWDIKKTLCSDILSPSWHGKIYKPAGCTGYYQKRIRKEHGGLEKEGKDFRVENQNVLHLSGSS